jgi:pSer/pThr/pTyr-binding forkhead associated (FHA) protein
MELPEGVAFCDACGTPLRGTQQGSRADGSGNGSGHLGSVVCPICAAAAMPGEAFCDNCGASLLAPTTYVSPDQSSSRPAAASPASTQPSAGGQASTRQVIAQLVVTSPPPPATIPLPGRTEIIVGRSDPQSNSYPDVDLGPYGGLDLGVSRRHFRLTRTGDQFYVEDLGAMNGTAVNDQRLPPHTLQPLRTGDRIALGKMDLRFELSS